jgi:beta-galactosidase/beta-glucuronidase
MYAALLMLVLACSGVEETAAPTMIFLDGEGWMLATDPGNVGVAEKWWTAPRSDAKSAKVPGVIQDLFPGYSGAAWYWRDVTIPANPHEGGRYLLRFWDVDYVADVWVNGTHVGRHEGAQTKFAFDVTDAVKPDTTNRIAVRVLSVFNTPVDGIVRSQTPHGGFAPFNIGGRPVRPRRPESR